MKLPALLAVCHVLCASLALADSQKVTPESLPPAVWKTIQSQSDGRQPNSIERDETDGIVSYQVALPASGGGERTLTVGGDGALLSAEVALTETPVEVQKAITAQLNGGSLDGIEKTVDEGEVSYDVDFTSKAGQERTMSIAADGTLLSIEVGLEETPPAVQSTIKTQFGEGKISQIEKTIDDGIAAYEVGYTTKDGKERSFSVGAEGKLTSVEVVLDSLTPAAQKTVNNKIGSGRIVRVSQTIGDKQTVTNYVVEGIVEGRQVSFKVGLKGKLLGKLE